MRGMTSWARSACRRHRWPVSLAVTLALSAGGQSADAAGPLQWNFKNIKALHYQMVQNTVTEVKAGGQNIKTNVSQTLDTDWEVQSVDDKGTAEMTQTIASVRTKIDSPFGAFEYSSGDKKDPEGAVAASIVPMLKALVGAKFRYKISASGELTDIQLPDSLMKTLKESSATAANAGMFTEDGLKNMIRESSLILPDAVDKPWTRKSEIPSPPIGTLMVEKVYSYKQPEKDKSNATIDLAIKVDLKPAPGSNLDVKIASQDGKGTFSFNQKEGRVESSNVSQKVEMVITVMNNTQVNQSTDTKTEMKLIKIDPK
jgi:hypothetical protein